MPLIAFFQEVIDAITPAIAADAVIWGFRVVVITFVGVIAWFLRRTAQTLDHCQLSISGIRETLVPNLDKRVALVEQKIDVAEKEIDQLQLRSIARGHE